MTATDSGDSGALGRELQTAQEQQADNPCPSPSLPASGMGLGGVWQVCFWTEALWRPSAVGDVKQCGRHRRIACSHRVVPGPGTPLAHCMCCPLGGHWTLDLGLPCAYLECLERACGPSPSLVLPFPRAEEAYLSTLGSRRASEQLRPLQKPLKPGRTRGRAGVTEPSLFRGWFFLCLYCFLFCCFFF